MSPSAMAAGTWGSEPEHYPPGWIQRLSGVGTALVVLLSVTVLVDLIAVVVDLHQWKLLKRLAAGEALSDVQSSDDGTALVSGIQLLLFVATFVLLLVWLQRAYQNAIRMGSRLPHTPGWAIGAWFVPLLNLVRPKQMVEQAWQASDPGLPPGHYAWMTAPTSPLVTMWWAAWLIDSILGNLLFRHTTGDGIEGLVTAARLLVCSDALDVIAAVLLLLVVRGLTARQTARIAVVGA